MFEMHILASGSDGNCTVLVHEDRAVMIDAGLSFKATSRLMSTNGIDPSSVEALLITHEHSDHVKGAGPVARALNIPVMCNRSTFLSSNMGRVLYSETQTMVPFTVAGIRFTPLPTSHNAMEPNAYMAEASGKRVLIATDTGVLTPPVEDALRTSDVAILESNYDKYMLDNGPYPIYLRRLIESDIGHLSNVACAEALKRTTNGMKRKIFLAHLSRKNNTPDTARETVSNLTGTRRMELDCLEFAGDTRILRA